MLQTVRTNFKNKAYQELVTFLDKEIAHRDGDDFEFYNQFNSSDNINEVVLIMSDQKVVGCGAFKRYDSHTAEVKRMYTRTAYRGKGVETQILEELEKWALELNYAKFILETGKKYTEAIALYQKHGFIITVNYAPYEDVEDSVCFSKTLR